MYALEKSVLKKELNKYKYLLYRATHNFATINKNQTKFLKQRIKELNVELQFISKHVK